MAEEPANTFTGPFYERHSLLQRLAASVQVLDGKIVPYRRKEAVCFRGASIEAALRLQSEGRVICRWEDDGLLIVSTPTRGPLPTWPPEAA